jgi:carbon-monoxide dehydrogenase medium subunit
VRAGATERALAAGAVAEDAAAHAADGLEPVGGLDGSAEYKRHVACVLTRRALLAVA